MARARSAGRERCIGNGRRLAELRARAPRRRWLWVPAAIIVAGLAGYLWGLHPQPPAAPLDEPLKLKLERSLSMPRS
jgi:hypothetical protein